jgi:hypothetical protein
MLCLFQYSLDLLVLTTTNYCGVRFPEEELISRRDEPSVCIPLHANAFLLSARGSLARRSACGPVHTLSGGELFHTCLFLAFAHTPHKVIRFGGALSVEWRDFLPRLLRKPLLLVCLSACPSACPSALLVRVETQDNFTTVSQNSLRNLQCVLSFRFALALASSVFGAVRFSR